MFSPPDRAERTQNKPLSVCNNVEPIAVLLNVITCGNNDLTIAYICVGRVKLIERAAFDCDLSVGSVLAVQCPLRCYALECTAVDLDRCVVIGIDEIKVVVVICRNADLSEVAAVDNNLRGLVSPNATASCHVTVSPF